MIKIKTKKVKAKRNTIDLVADANNMVCRDLAKFILNDVKDFQCEEHPKQDSTLAIIADRKKIFKVDKSGFCCSEFADSIKINRG